MSCDLARLKSAFEPQFLLFFAGGCLFFVELLYLILETFNSHSFADGRIFVSKLSQLLLKTRDCFSWIASHCLHSVGRSALRDWEESRAKDILFYLTTQPENKLSRVSFFVFILCLSLQDDVGLSPALHLAKSLQTTMPPTAQNFAAWCKAARQLLDNLQAAVQLGQHGTRRVKKMEEDCWWITVYICFMPGVNLPISVCLLWGTSFDVA